MALAQSRSVGHIFTLLGQALKSLYDPEVVQVWTVGDDGRELHLALTQVADENRLAAMLSDYTVEDLEAASFNSAEAVCLREIVVHRATEVVPQRLAEIMTAGRVEMTVSLPIAAGEDVHGAINMLFKEARPLGGEDLRLLEAISRTVAVAVQTARLFEEVVRERRSLGTILNELPTAILLAEGEEGRITRVNRAFERLLGPAEGLDLQGYCDRFPVFEAGTRQPVPMDDRPLTRALRGCEASSAEQDTISQGGVRRCLIARAAPLNDPMGSLPAAILSLQDVTALKDLEREHRRQSRLLQFTFDNVPAGMAILDAEDGTCVELNETFARFFQDPGITRDCLLGRRVHDLFPEFDSSGAEAIFQRVRDAGERLSTIAFEFEGFPRGKTWWNVSVLPLEEGDRVVNLLIFAVEVTALVQAGHELRAALAEAETAGGRLEALNRELIDAGRVKDEFLSTLSHELRTPLTPILGWTRILKGHGSEAGLLEQGLRAIERNVMIQVRLVDDLLDLSRLAYDKIQLNREKVELSAILREAWEEVWPEAQVKGIEGKFDFAGVPLMMDGDRLRLRQIFINLLANAVKFTEEGGRIELRSCRVGECVEAVVADDGIGIEPEFLPRVFDRFEQADPSTTRRHGGLGIGLSIARSLTEMHDGSIVAESPGRGKGTTFRVRFPALDVLPSEAPPEAQAPDLAGIRVLLADDEPDTLEAIRCLLELQQAQVVAVGSGYEALELALEEQPDLLLCDIEMSDLDGLEVASRLRASPETASLRMIALSGHGFAADRDRAREAGFDEHLLKPVEPRVLFAAIVRVLESGSGALRE